MMRKMLISFALCLLVACGLMAQPVTIVNEGFESTSSSFNAPGGGWTQVSDLRASGTKSYLGWVPTQVGDSTEFVSGWFDCEAYSNVVLTFDHICKVSAMDEATIEYQIDQLGAKWTRIPMDCYKGLRTPYKQNRFSHMSYSEWHPDDSLAMPSNAWWHSETFDLSSEVGWERVRFKFKIKRGKVVGTQFAYGWLVDNFVLMGSTHQIELPAVEFMILPSDTEYSTGPFEVRAKVATRTIARIYPPKLMLTYTYNHVVTNDSIAMQSVEGDSIWTATIPQQLFGTEIVFSIRGLDTMGNEKTITSKSYLTRNSAGGNTGYITVGTGTSTECYIPFYRYYGYGWSRMLYTSAELGKKGGLITKMAFDVSTTGVSIDNQRCYMKAVSDTRIASANYIDPVKDGATLVWSGTYNSSKVGWNEYTLDKTFMLPPGKSLLIYWENYMGSYTSPYTYWHCTSTSQNMAVYKYQDGSFPAVAGSLTTSYRPNLRIYTISGSSDSNSVGLYALNSPGASVIAGETTYVNVDIQNAGIANLKSCKINWSVNGVRQTTYNWSGNLPDNYIDTNITLGYYLPRLSMQDTVLVWVSDPNGVTDKTTYDDTLSIITYGCGSKFAGEYIVGPKSGADFSSIADACEKIAMCGSNGNVTLKLQSGKYGGGRVEDMSAVMGNDTLIITSLTGNKEDVVFAGGPSGNTLFIIADAKNVVVKNISFIPDSAYTNINYGIAFTGNNKNVELRDCYVYMDSTTSATKYCVYNASTGIDTNIRIIHNEFIGGYYGLYFYGGTSTSVYGQEIVIDSNRMAKAYYYGYYLYYNDIKSFSHNTMEGRLSSVGTYNYNYLYYCNLAKFDGNRYDYYNTPVTYLYNYFYYVNRYNTSDQGLYCNNEVIGPRTATTVYGVYLGYSNMDIINNTFLLKNGYGVYNYNYNAGLSNVCNNIMVNTATSGTYYPFYSGSTYTHSGIATIDYNLYYAKGRVGYWGSNKATLADWQKATGQDAHSLFQKPVFFNFPDLDSLNAHPDLYDSVETRNTRLAIYTGLDCPVLPTVTEDMVGIPRAGQTVMGCYAGEPMELDAALSSLIGIGNSEVKGVVSTLRAVITNMGETTLTSAKVGWSENGVVRNAADWTGSLVTYASDTIDLGTVTTLNSNNVLKIWVGNPNNAADKNIFNDTLVHEYTGCDSLYHGTYTVGQNSDFASVTDAVNAIGVCGMDGPVVLKIASGTYDALMLNMSPKGMSSVNTLTLESATGKASDVVFMTKSGYVLTMSSISNLRIKNITFDGLLGTGAATMVGQCNNVIIDGCVFKANNSTSGTTTYCFNKTSGAACDSIILLNNVFEGGYYGLYFYGSGTGAGGYNTNIHIDSNQFIDAGYYCHYFYYNDLVSFSHNTIKNTGKSSYYYNYFYYTNHTNTVCNTWDFSQSTAQYVYTYFYYPHYYNFRNNQGFIANNAFIYPETSQGGYCMYMGYPGETQKVYHNTMYNPGSSGYGFYGYFSSAGSNPVVDFVNNLVVADKYWPFYSTGTLVNVISDYNNLYSGSGKVGYWQGASCNSLSAWATASGDNTSVAVNPSFLGFSFAGAELTSNQGLTCPALNDVPEDITGMTRNTPTTMGCYELNSRNEDLFAVRFVSPDPDVTLTAGNTVKVRILVKNIGRNAVTSFKVNWTVNGVQQNVFNWTGNMASMMGDTIEIGSFQAISGINKLTAYVSMPNGKADERPINDTIAVSATGCDSLFQGAFTMGKGGDFIDFDDFVQTVAKCGLGGPITLKLLSGVYDCMNLNQTIRGASGKNTITITSAAGNADSVIIMNSAGNEPTVIFDGGVHHVTLEKVTVMGCADGGNMSGVWFADCDSITVRKCKIIGYVEGEPMWEDGSGFVSDHYTDFGEVWIEDNEVSGMSYGAYMMSYNYGASILHFNGNTVKFRYCGANIDGKFLDEFCNNTFLYEEGIEDNYLYLAEIYGPGGGSGRVDTALFTNNRWLTYDAGTFDYAYIDIYELGGKKCLLFANNEIIFPAGMNNGYGYIEDLYDPLYVNNSVYMPTGTMYWAYNYGKTSMVNNLVYANMDFNSNSFGYSDYNNFAKMSVSALQNTTRQDTHSVSILPAFSDLRKGMNLLDNSGLECPVFPAVLSDINGTQRQSLTTMGCYEVPAVPNNAMPRAFVSPNNVTITGTDMPITVQLFNAGSNALTSCNIDLVVNGVAYPQHQWSGNLASKQSVPVQLGSFVPVADANNLVVWTSSPNGQSDAVPANDTLNFVAIGCDSILKGDYIVTNDAELKAIITSLQTCGVEAPTTIKLANGQYRALDLQEAFINVTSVNTVTFTSLSGIADSVVIAGETNLGNLSHVRFSYLTFDWNNTATHTINFVKSCSDVEFYACRILASPTASGTGTGGYCVYNTSTFSTDSIRFIKNLINGGYYGLYWYGQSTGNMNTNTVIDSNTIQNQYYYAMYGYYNEFTSVSQNSILSRTANQNTYWYGLYSYYGNLEKCDGNRIHVRTSAITYPYPAYINYAGRYGSMSMSNFTNNEILTYTTSTYYGMYSYYNNINIYHNTIYVGGTGAGRGIYVYTSGEKTDIQNNVIVTMGSGSFPIYMNNSGAATSDYNCLYSPSYAGYDGGNMTFSAWQNAGYDIHGFFVNPSFTRLDSAEYLKLDSTNSMFVPVITGVNADRLDNPRYGMTSPGAYASTPKSLDAALTEFPNWSTSGVIGKQTPVTVRLMNMGTGGNLTSATIDWYVRGVKQTPVTWTGNLAQYATADVYLGSYVTIAEANNVSACVSHPNNATDLEHSNDSISTFNYGCDSMLHGYYRVGGQNADFASLNDAITALNYCGVDGPTTMALASGTYASMSFGVLNGVSSKNMVTFTSQSGYASDVVITGTNALVLNAAQHLAFTKLTLGNASTTCGVIFNGSCKHVDILYCNINSSPTTTSSSYYAVKKASGAVMDSIRIVGNHINGGYYGVYIYGANTNAGGYNTNIRIDSNLCENAYYYPHYFYYTDFTSLNGNTFLPRTSGTTYWYGYMYYCNSPEMMYNRYNTTRCASMTYFYNYMDYVNYYNWDGGRMLYANNEIIHTSNSGGYGLYYYCTKADIIHNSIMCKSATYGMYADLGQCDIVLKNNNIVNFNGQNGLYAYNYRNIVAESNNIYCPGGSYIGNTTFTTQADLSLAMGDPNLTVIRPRYVDSTVNLEQVSYTGLSCLRDSLVPTDINNSERARVTVRGCYSLPIVEGKNIQMVDIVSPKLNTVVACYPDFSTAEVEIANMGTDTLDFSKDNLVVHMASDSANVFYTDTTLTSGIMYPMSKMRVKITDFFPTALTGYYNITSWLTMNGDMDRSDDTAYTVYEVTRVVLPFEVDFTTMPQEFAFDSLQGRVQWELADGSAAQPAIAPAYGDGMLHFASSTGRASLSRVVIKQVDLSGSSKPKLSFWYAHDNSNPEARDYMEVLASTDGGMTYERLMTVFRYDASFTTPGWKMYQYDLSKYINETCLHIAFEAASYGGSDQNVDRVQIQVEQDVDVKEILVTDSLSACDLNNRTVSVVLDNSTMYDVNFDRPDSIRLHIELMKPDSSVARIQHTMKGRLLANTSDTVVLASGYNFDLPGTYTFRTYIDTVTLTTDVTNDTMIRQINVLPDLYVFGMDTILAKKAGDSVVPTVYVFNSGNLTAQEVKLRLKVNDENDIVEVSNQPLYAGDTLKYTFKQGFIVPAVDADQPYYFLTIESEMGCDMDASNDLYSYVGTVSLVDMSVYNIENPKAAESACDTGNTNLYININLYNYGDVVIDSATIHVKVDSANVVVRDFTEQIKNLSMGNTNYSLKTPYLVPNFNGKYTVTVYVENVAGEMNYSNDTARIEACAVRNDVSVEDFDADAYAVGQNIPNPASDVTVIPFRVPQDGVVRLDVLSVSGQVLYTRILDARAGNNEFELSVSNLSGGIYYYSMEYQGKRIVKKMNVAR